MYFQYFSFADQLVDNSQLMGSNRVIAGKPSQKGFPDAGRCPQLFHLLLKSGSDVRRCSPNEVLNGIGKD
jgi:hypothetical protein